METVEVVIRLPEKTYRKILSNEYDYGDMNVIIQAGTPLPKGHGGLIDYDDIISEYIKRVHSYMSEKERMNLFCTIVDEAPTIIEADRGDDNG